MKVSIDVFFACQCHLPVALSLNTRMPPSNDNNDDHNKWTRVWLLLELNSFKLDQSICNSATCCIEGYMFCKCLDTAGVQHCRYRRSGDYQLIHRTTTSNRKKTWEVISPRQTSKSTACYRWLTFEPGCLASKIWLYFRTRVENIRWW